MKDRLLPWCVHTELKKFDEEKSIVARELGVVFVMDYKPTDLIPLDENWLGGMYWSPGESKVIDGKKFTYEGDGHFKMEPVNVMTMSKVEFVRDAQKRLAALHEQQRTLVEELSNVDWITELVPDSRSPESFYKDLPSALDDFLGDYEAAKKVVDDGDRR